MHERNDYSELGSRQKEYHRKFIQLKHRYARQTELAEDGSIDYDQAIGFITEMTMLMHENKELTRELEAASRETEKQYAEAAAEITAATTEMKSIEEKIEANENELRKRGLL